MSNYIHTAIPVNCSQICEPVEMRNGSYTIKNIPYLHFIEKGESQNTFSAKLDHNVVLDITKEEDSCTGKNIL